jgi:hypothetical protein
MGLGHDRGPGSLIHPFGCTGQISRQRWCCGLFVAMVSRNFSPNSPVVHFIRIDVMHGFGVATLAFIVARYGGFVCI